MRCSLVPLESSLRKLRSPTKKGANTEMMDQERTEKELEAFFGEIQHSYEAFANDAFVLQERTLRFARELLENPTDAEASDSRATLEELAEKSRDEHERFEMLARKASEAYLRVLKGPVEEHYRKIKEAEADLKKASPS